MKTLYLECNMGAAGDMLTAALLEIHPDPDSFISRFNQLGIPGVKMESHRVSRCGISGTHVSMLVDGREEDEHLHDLGHHHHEHHHEEHCHEHHHDDHEHSHEDHHDHGHDHETSNGHDYHHHEHHHEHHSLDDITRIISDFSLDEIVKQDIRNVFHIIAEAESAVHDKPLTEIHFHEVGTMDAIADVTAVCMLLHELDPDRIIASPVCTGSGTVHCAHGVLPVPAPATANILKGIPSYSGEIRSELCTPTGAAILKYFASSFEPMPVMSTEAIGYGCGKKEFPTANVVRAFFGTTEDGTDTVLELECNVDDMTGEEIGFACEEFLHAGAKDVFTIPIQMKKNRPGILLKVLCSPEDRERMVSLVFKHTTTIGIRQTVKQRYILDRNTEEKDGKHGTYIEKVSRGYDVVRRKAEYESLAKIARDNNLSLIDLRNGIEDKEV